MRNTFAITADVAAISDDDYLTRKSESRCTYPGCPDTACDDAVQCDRHRLQAAARQRRSRRKRRRLRGKLQKFWAAKQLCLRCGGKRLSGEKHCVSCLVSDGRARSLVSHNERNKSQRITDNTAVDRDGRSRYHGQGKRGRQSVAATDDKDLEYTLDAVTKARDGLALAAVPELEKSQRQEAKAAALSQLDHASRFIDDVLERNHYFDPTAGRRGG